MNSLHHGVPPATEGREKGRLFHASFAVHNISLGLSALQFDKKDSADTCPADVQLIVKGING